MRPTTHQPYGPGKFEDESCIARFAYNVMLNGFSKPKDDDPGVDVITGPFAMTDVDQFEQDTKEQMCQECVDTLITLDHVSIYETDNGFVYASA
ncbi:hypothetical protein LCGC14_0363960 [marine sediment metagenome]|uniref:Uncharacterized protein n=1 Tax=marine sediment metagenome TaxID=412755 RepID=A0A0F9TQ29_9ZZZZ